MNANDTSKDKRILVLGSKPLSRAVSTYQWEQIPQYLNVADYDNVIVNLTSLQTRKDVSRQIIDTLPSWQQIGRLLFSEGSELIIIGFPNRIEYKGQYGTGYYEFHKSFPLFLKCIFDNGEEIRDVIPEFSYYFKHVKKWLFHADGKIDSEDDLMAKYLQVVCPRANEFLIGIEPIAQTRYQKPIAFELIYKAVWANERARNPRSRDLSLEDVEILGESGKLIWLPPTTEIPIHEAIVLILKERYGLCLEQTRPSWVENHKLPRQIPIEGAISTIQSEISRLREQLSAKHTDLENEKRFQKLLYEQGIDGLEPIVRETLGMLNATVEEPKRRGIEDGRLIDPKGRHGILEIKGKTGTLALKDVRQLDQWVRDAMTDDEWDGKGILLLNSFCDIPIEQRENPFPDNCIKLAERFESCLLTTTQLFYALCQEQEGKLNLEDFWDSIFETKGVCPLPGLEKWNKA